MTYQDWINKINELLKPLKSYQARDKRAYRLYLTGQTPQEFVDEGEDLAPLAVKIGHFDNEDETGEK